MEMQVNSRLENIGTRRKIWRSKSNSIEKTDMDLLLRKNGLMLKKTTGNAWNRLTLFQFITQISGWTYVLKLLIIVFFIDDESEWNHYLGDWSLAVGKSNILHENTNTSSI